MLRRGAGWWCVLLGMALVACGAPADPDALVAGQSAATPDPDLPTAHARLPITLGNDQAAIYFDRDTGRIVQVEDRHLGTVRSLLDPERHTAHVPPVEIEEIRAKPLQPEKLEIVTLDLPERAPAIITQTATKLVLRWNYLWPLPQIEVEWRVSEELPELRATVRVYPRQNHLTYRVRYPILPGLAPLNGDGASDQFLCSKEGGLLLSDPLKRLIEDGPDPYALANQRYPDGHETMAQLMAYLHPGDGGLLVYTPDDTFSVKFFGLSDRGRPGSLDGVVGTLDVTHENPDVEDVAGAGVYEPPYPVVLRWLDTGEWTEAAEIYRQWSDQQVWASDPIAQRAPAEREFFERVGASVFGLSAREDQQAWIAAFHEALVDGIDAARLLYVLGWDFHPMGAPELEQFTAFHQAAWDEAYWSPLQGATADNYAAARAGGDYAMPFLYDQLVHSGYNGWEGFAAAADEIGAPWIEHVQYGPLGDPGGFIYWNPRYPGAGYTLCVADPMTIDWYHWRDKLLVNLFAPAADGLYFDLGLGVANHDCYAALAGYEHGHPAGAGGAVVEGAREALDLAVGTPNPRGFRYGVENPPEVYVDLVDFWHLGAGGVGPYRDRIPDDVGEPSAFLNFNRWLMEGTGVEVPLLAYLQHHLGALRTGGKIQISFDVGDAFYWVTASEYLWGGVVELIYFNTGVDWLPNIDPDATPCAGQTPCAFQTSWGQGYQMPRGWTYGDEVRRADPDKLDYLREAIALRVASPATPYLTMGRMEPPAVLDPAPPPVSYSYDYYSSISGPRACHAGTWTGSAVIHTAWRHPTQNTVALLLANATNQTVNSNLVVDPRTYGMTAAIVRRIDLAHAAARVLTTERVEGGRAVNIPLKLAPREWVMYELTPDQ